MNILIISPEFPYPIDAGAKETIFHTLKGLSQQNKIHLITFYREQTELQGLPELNKYCDRVDTVYNRPWSTLKTVLFNLLYLFTPTPTLVVMHQSKEMRKCIGDALSNNHYDIVQIELTQMASYLPPRTESATILVEHDVTFLSRHRRLAHAPNLLMKLHWLIQYLKIKHFELSYCKKFDQINTVTEQCKSELEKHCPGSRISVVRPGVEISVEPVFDNSTPYRKVLFLGSMSHWPNQDAVLYFYNSILPLIRETRKDVEFVIVGRDAEMLPTVIKNDGNVRITGFVEDIKPHLKGAISIAPIRYGSGIRTKILNYMACGSPVVSTSIGAEGIEIANAENIVIADEPRAFATAVANLLNNNELGRRIAIGGFNLVKEKYQWDKTISDLQNEYTSLLQKKRYENSP